MKRFPLILVGVMSFWGAETPPRDPAAQPKTVVPTQTPASPQVAADVRPETARARIIQRNLFHPTRGVMPSSWRGADVSQAGLPLLLGTLIRPKHPSALLRWGAQDTRIVEEGDELEGFRIKKISANRLQLVRLQDGITHWVELDPALPAEGGPASELEALLALSSKKPSTAPGRSQ